MNDSLPPVRVGLPVRSALQFKPRFFACRKADRYWVGNRMGSTCPR